MFYFFFLTPDITNKTWLVLTKEPSVWSSECNGCFESKSLYLNRLAEEKKGPPRKAYKTQNNICAMLRELLIRPTNVHCRAQPQAHFFPKIFVFNAF